MVLSGLVGWLWLGRDSTDYRAPILGPGRFRGNFFWRVQPWLVVARCALVTSLRW